MNSEKYDAYVEMVTDKNVIIVGPGSTVFDDCSRLDVDSYDLVCRLNYHWKTKLGQQKSIGKRMDILYHCLNAPQYTPGDLQEWKDDGISVLTHHDMEYHVNHVKTKLYQKRNANVGFEIQCVPHSLFLDFKKRFKSSPNTGTMAIIHLLSLPVKTVTVVGFDFYSSLYWFNKSKALLNAIHKSPHGPKIQFANFKEYVKDFDNFIPVGRLKEMLDKE